MVIAKLLVIGAGKVKDFDISNNPTLAGLIDAAQNDPDGTFDDVDFDGLDAYVNGSKLTDATYLKDNDRVTLSQKVKGNLDGFEVQVVRIGTQSGIVSLPATAGMKIRDVLNQLDSETKKEFYRADGSPIYEYRTGTGQIVTDDHVLDHPAGGMTRILMSAKTKGNLQ
jgi:hypothetical protein